MSEEKSKLKPEEPTSVMVASAEMTRFLRVLPTDIKCKLSLYDIDRIYKVIQQLRALAAPAAVPEDWEKWIEQNAYLPDFHDPEMVTACDLRARLSELGPSVPVSELRDTLDAWLTKPENDRLVSDLWALIAKHTGEK